MMINIIIIIILVYYIIIRANKKIKASPPSSSWSIQIYIGIEIYNTDIVPQVRFMA